MRILKILQNPDSGKIGIQVNPDEKYDIKKHLELLSEFASEQAVITHELRKSNEEFVKRLGECEKKLSEVIENQRVN